MSDNPRPADRTGVATLIAYKAQELSDLADRHGFPATAGMLAMAAKSARDEQRTARRVDS